MLKRLDPDLDCTAVHVEQNRMSMLDFSRQALSLLQFPVGRSLVTASSFAVGSLFYTSYSDNFADGVRSLSLGLLVGDHDNYITGHVDKISRTLALEPGQWALIMS